MIAHLRSGDIITVWKLDGLGRSLRDLIDLISIFKSKDVSFISIHDSIDILQQEGSHSIYLLL